MYSLCTLCLIAFTAVEPFTLHYADNSLENVMGNVFTLKLLILTNLKMIFQMYSN